MGGKGDFEGREVIEVMLESANIETTRTVATATFIGGAPENAAVVAAAAAAVAAAAAAAVIEKDDVATMSATAIGERIVLLNRIPLMMGSMGPKTTNSLAKKLGS